jgi:hypothetical protein
MQILDKQTANPLFTASISARQRDAARKRSFKNDWKSKKPAQEIILKIRLLLVLRLVRKKLAAKNQNTVYNTV